MKPPAGPDMLNIVHFIVKCKKKMAEKEALPERKGS